VQQSASDAARDIEQQRLAERMEQSADAMRRSADARRGASANTPSPDGAPMPSQAGTQEELARALERIADRLNAPGAPQDDESRKLTDQLARARELRERLDDLNRQLESVDRQAGDRGNPGQSGSRPGDTPGRNGQPGQSDGQSGGDAAETERLRTEIGRQMQEVRELLNEMPRDNRDARMPGGPGATFEGQGMVLSAPGTEGFKQDFAKWQELKRQVTLALDDVESSLAKRLQDKAAKDRLASGVDEKVPAGYEQQVDSYFKALATRKRP
jgi:hypothetical protein